MPPTQVGNGISVATLLFLIFSLKGSQNEESFSQLDSDYKPRANPLISTLEPDL